MQYTYDIKTIQHLLLQAGFDPGPADGLWGAATLGAPARFQASRGLPPSGKIDMETLHRLGYSGPGSQHLANVTVRRVRAATSLCRQDRLANHLFNISDRKSVV